MFTDSADKCMSESDVLLMSMIFQFVPYWETFCLYNISIKLGHTWQNLFIIKFVISFTEYMNYIKKMVLTTQISLEKQKKESIEW